MHLNKVNNVENIRFAVDKGDLIDDLHSNNNARNGRSMMVCMVIG